MDRRTFLLGSLAASAAITACGGSGGSDAAPSAARLTGESRTYGDTRLAQRVAGSGQPNVLFLSIDDLNDWTGFLRNHPGTRTPNFDALASEGLVFSKAYTPVPICLGARTATLWSQPPEVTGVYDHTPASRERYAELAETRPSVVDDFWAAGYRTIGAGKVFHDAQSRRWDENHETEHYVPASARDEPNYVDRFDPDWRSPYDGQVIGDGTGLDGSTVDFGPSGRTTMDDPDGISAAWIIDRLGDDHRQPFFMAYGTFIPHEPWRVPQQYFDMHPLDEVVLPDVPDDDLDDLPVYARETIVDSAHSFEVWQTSGKWREAVQAYQAAISFADDLVGRILDALYSTPQGDDTIVALWSDHGFHLGEKMHVHKFTLWEQATHVPLVVRAPGTFEGGDRFEPPVSLIDVAPTLHDLADVRPNAPQAGASLVDLVSMPERAVGRPPVTTWLPGNHSVRSEEWRYIRYETGETELYDQETDPDEFTNLSGLPEYADLEAELDAFLPEGD